MRFLASFYGHETHHVMDIGLVLVDGPPWQDGGTVVLLSGGEKVRYTIGKAVQSENQRTWTLYDLVVDPSFQPPNP